MAVKNYIVSKCLSFSPDGKIHVDARQMSVDDSYEIVRPFDIIAESVFDGLEPMLDGGYTVKTIHSLMNTNGRYRFRLMDEGVCDDIQDIIFSVDNDRLTYYYDIIRSESGEDVISERYMYKINSIDESKVGYLVSEYIIDPSEDCTLLEHCYHPCFTDLNEAFDYLDEMQASYEDYIATASDTYLESPDSGYRLFVVDIDEMEQSTWYKDHLEIAEAFERYGESEDFNREDYRLMSDKNTILNTLYAKEYNYLLEEDQCRVDTMIYESLRKYIDADSLAMLDDEMNDEDVTPDTIMYVADQAIALSLLQAESEEVFNEIHEVLGPNEWRVGCLTDDIWNKHPGKGYIVITIDNRMQWYAECYSINEWEGAKGNPFFGVFQKNEPESLFCFREYHPECIARRLPTDKDLEKYELMYQEACSKVRGVHSEMRFINSSDGQSIVVGDWYRDGITAKYCEKGAAFFQTYLSHTFSIDECKRLLSGEEVTIEHFKSKMGDDISIRGKLGSCFGAPDGVTLEFVRTDINPKQRRLIGAEYGITEAGIIDDDDDWA